MYPFEALCILKVCRKHDKPELDTKNINIKYKH